MTCETARMDGDTTIDAIADVLADVIYEQLAELGDDIKGLSWFSALSDQHQPFELPLAA